MGWTYTGNHALARAASALYAARAQPCRLAPLALMSDPQRLPDICTAAQSLPRGSAVIYRHFGASDRFETAAILRQIAFARGLQFLIGKDVQLAAASGADGVHLPEADLGAASPLRRRYPDWLLSGAVHSKAALMKANAGRGGAAGLDAAIVSPVFESQSPSAGAPLGVAALARLTKSAALPVFALGGINAKTAPLLIGSGAAGIAGVSGIANG